MLKLVLPAFEQYDEGAEEFVYSKEYTLQLEHSLVSISKWESKWCKPFLSRDDKPIEETIDYIQCMTLTQNINPDVYKGLTNGNIREVSDYINAPMTATIFPKNKTQPGREIITAEIIYHWMIMFNIPVEFQKWHLNRLLALIKVCNIKNQPKGKMSQKEIMSRNAALNAQRRQALNTKG